MDASVKHGAGKNGKLRRERLKVVLMSRFEESNGTAQSIWDALADLMKGRDLSEVVETLEICGILSHSESLEYEEQQAIEEARASSSPIYAAPMTVTFRL